MAAKAELIATRQPASLRRVVGYTCLRFSILVFPDIHTWKLNISASCVYDGRHKQSSSFYAPPR
jgi:hypothetical protein